MARCRAFGHRRPVILEQHPVAEASWVFKSIQNGLTPDTESSLVTWRWPGRRSGSAASPRRSRRKWHRRCESARQPSHLEAQRTQAVVTGYRDAGQLVGLGVVNGASGTARGGAAAFTRGRPAAASRHTASTGRNLIGRGPSVRRRPFGQRFFEKPVSSHPKPSNPAPAALEYRRDSDGCVAGLIGSGVQSGIAKFADPSKPTENEPVLAPTSVPVSSQMVEDPPGP